MQIVDKLRVEYANKINISQNVLSKLTGFAGLVKLAGCLHDNVAH